MHFDRKGRWLERYRVSSRRVFLELTQLSSSVDQPVGLLGAITTFTFLADSVQRVNDRGEIHGIPTVRFSHSYEVPEVRQRVDGSTSNR